MHVCGLASSAGMEAQVRALAEALGVNVQMKNIFVRPPFVWLPNRVFAAGLKRFVIPHMLAAESDRIENPLPDLVISCGRRAAMVALGLQPSIPAKYIHIQDPHIHPRNFNAVVAMRHDAIRGDNVIRTEYALHAVTPEKLQAAVTHFAPLLAPYPRPYVSVLLGGSTNKYVLTPQRFQKTIEQLNAMLNSMPGALLITVSRRTGAANIRLLKEMFAQHHRVYIYDGSGDNPYLALLGAADSIAVTNDSVNMMSEAAATGKPLYLLPLDGHLHTKPSHFAERLLQKGVARLWAGAWESWGYDASHEMKELPQKIKQLLSF